MTRAVSAAAAALIRAVSAVNRWASAAEADTIREVSAVNRPLSAASNSRSRCAVVRAWTATATATESSTAAVLAPQATAVLTESGAATAAHTHRDPVRAAVTSRASAVGRVEGRKRSPWGADGDGWDGSGGS